MKAVIDGELYSEIKSVCRFLSCIAGIYDDLLDEDEESGCKNLTYLERTILLDRIRLYNNAVLALQTDTVQRLEVRR